MASAEPEDSAQEVGWRPEKGAIDWQHSKPPPEAEALTSDGQLHKLTLREGEGELPPKHARCLVHYVGRLADSGEVFMDTRMESQTEEPEEVVAGRELAYRELGLNKAVATMRRGEVARLWLGPQYGYGEKGSFSFPTVPPSANLVYELELVDFEDPDDSEEVTGMLFEQRLEAAERRRVDGNALFKEGRLDAALSKYRLALSFMNEDFMMQLDDMHLQQAQAVRRPTLLNIAAAQLRKEDYHGAIATCGEVLTEDPTNAKALFRRGKARYALGQTEGAVADLEAAHRAEPGDGGIARELAAARRAAREERQASGQLFKGFFEKSNEALYEEPPASQQPAVDPAAAEATEALLRELERRERPGASLLHSRGVRLALTVGLLAVVLAAAARGAMRMGLGQLLPRWLPLG